MAQDQAGKLRLVMSLMKFIRDWHYAFCYTNHKGVTADRRIRFLALEHGTGGGDDTEPQFFVRGVDLQQNALRSFAISRINPLTVRRLHGG